MHTQKKVELEKRCINLFSQNITKFATVGAISVPSETRITLCKTSYCGRHSLSFLLFQNILRCPSFELQQKRGAVGFVSVKHLLNLIINQTMINNELYPTRKFVLHTTHNGEVKLEVVSILEITGFNLYTID